MPHEGNPDLTRAGVRSSIVEEIQTEDNLSRKRDQQKRFDVYNGRQDRYILERLQREFDFKTVQEMRKIFSINLSKRVIDSQASVYKVPPGREFSTKSGTELTETQETQLEMLYDKCRVNNAFKDANMMLKRHDQCAMMIVPDNMGGIKFRAIAPIHYDVIPDARDPEKAFAYILNVWDFDLNKTARDESNEETQLRRYKSNDRLNQKIADDNDRQAAEQRFVVWTPDLHFIMGKNGQLLTEIVDNPIGMLPFVDVAPEEKDFQFFVRRGSNTIDFSLDYGMMLSDLANVIRLQAYSQAVIKSQKQPVNMTIGPNHVLWLKVDPGAPQTTADFQFVTPSPDLAGNQQFMESLLSLFLTSLGLDPTEISGKGEGKTFNSGLDRLLAQIQRFEATRDDFDLFKRVERESFQILTAWSDAFQGATENQLEPDLMQGKLPEDVKMDVVFQEPVAVQTKSEREDGAIKLMEARLMSRKQAYIEINDVSDEVAEEALKEIDDEDILPGSMPAGGIDEAQVQQEQGDSDDQS